MRKRTDIAFKTNGKQIKERKRSHRRKKSCRVGTGRKDERRVGIMGERTDPAFKKSGKRKKMKERKNKAGKTDADFNKKGKRKKGRKDRRGNDVAFTAENKQKRKK